MCLVSSCVLVAGRSPWGAPAACPLYCCDAACRSLGLRSMARWPRPTRAPLRPRLFYVPEMRVWVSRSCTWAPAPPSKFGARRHRKTFGMEGWVRMGPAFQSSTRFSEGRRVAFEHTRGQASTGPAPFVSAVHARPRAPRSTRSHKGLGRSNSMHRAQNVVLLGM